MKFKWHWHWKKTIGYRIGAIFITLMACLIWEDSLFKSLEITGTVAVFKTIFYEIFENAHENIDHWKKKK